MNTKARLTLLVLALFCAACGSKYVVDSDGDLPDVNLGDGKCETANSECTLRAAIQEANADLEADVIEFENVSVISPQSALPALTSGNIDIRGEGAVTIDPDEGENATLTPTPRPGGGTPECSDGIDNDGDGRIDYNPTGSGDRECLSADDNDEANR